MTSTTGSWPRSTRRSRGFTVVELIVVMVIMVLLAGLAVPRFVGSLREERLRTAGRSMVSTLQLARSRAVAESTLTKAEFDYDRDMLTLSRLTRNEQVQAGEETEPTWETMDDSLARERGLPIGITIKYVGLDPLGGESQRLEELIFRPDGSADEAYVVLSGFEDEILAVEVDEVRFAPKVLQATTMRDLSRMESER